MKLVRYPLTNPLTSSSCVTVGNFDGLHLGHQALIDQVVTQAKATESQAVVVSMLPLPTQYFNGTDAVEVITRFKQKFQLLAAFGVDVLCLLNFNHNLAKMPANQFVQKILFDALRARYIVIGDDFKFGAERRGDYPLLKSMSEATEVTVKQLPSVEVAGVRVSSTAIRNALKVGDFVAVRRLLGRDFSILGRVATGRKMGRELGYPTINIELRGGAFSLHGIYVVTLILDGVSHPAVASVGYNPSVGGNAKRLEVHVLQFKQQVYGETVEVLFHKKLRNEVEFDSLTALKSAIESDIKETKKYFAQI